MCILLWVSGLSKLDINDSFRKTDNEALLYKNDSWKFILYIYIVIFFMADFKQLWQNQKPAVLGAGVLVGAGLLALIFSIVFIIK